MNETAWQKIFEQSVANGCQYVEPEERAIIAWPKSTWFQRRLDQVRAERSGHKESNKGE